MGSGSLTPCCRCLLAIHFTYNRKDIEFHKQVASQLFLDVNVSMSCRLENVSMQIDK